MFIFALLLFSVLPAHALERKIERISDFSCGLVLGDGYEHGSKPGSLNRGCSRDAENVYFSKKHGAVSAREKYISSLDSVAGDADAIVSWMGDFQDNSNNSYFIIRTSTEVLRCTNATPPVCTRLVLRTHPDYILDGIPYLNRMWMVNGTTSTTAAVFSLDRDLNFEYHPQAPHNTLVSGFYNRVFIIAGFRNRLLITGARGSESLLLFSGQDDGEDWTVGNQSTSPFNLRVGGNTNSEFVTCLMGVRNDAFYIGTLNKIYAVLGYSQDDFRLVEVANIGCLAPRSPVIFPEGDMIWLSRDGFYKMSGNSIEKISGNIDTLAKLIAVRALAHHTATGARFYNYSAANNNGDYWFSYTLDASPGTTFAPNDTVLVYERPGNNWTSFTGIRAASFVHNSGSCFSINDLYFGNSNGDGNVYSFGFQGSAKTGATGCSGGTVESSYTAKFQLWPYDGGDASTLKAFETAYVVSDQQPSEFFTSYSSMRTTVSYVMDADFLSAGSEIVVGTMTNVSSNRLQASRINFGQSGVGSIPKGRWISLGFTSHLQYNPLLIEEIILYYSVIGRI